MMISGCLDGLSEELQRVYAKAVISPKGECFVFNLNFSFSVVYQLIIELLAVARHGQAWQQQKLFLGRQIVILGLINQSKRAALLFIALLIAVWATSIVTAQEADSTVVIPLFDNDRYVGRFPNPVAPDRRNINEFIIFSGASIDEVTQLAWQSQDDGVARTWSEAYAYCKGIRLLNRSDWRLPTFHELLSIYDFVPVDFDNPKPAINESIFPNTKHDDQFNGEYWTATRDIERQSVRRTGSWYFAISFTLNTNTSGTQFSFFRSRAIADNQLDSTARAYTRCVI